MFPALAITLVIVLSRSSAGAGWPCLFCSGVSAQPWDTLVYVIAAVVIVGLNRKTMFTRHGAVTEVLMPGEEGDPDAGRITERAA